MLPVFEKIEGKYFFYHVKFENDNKRQQLTMSMDFVGGEGEIFC